MRRIPFEKVVNARDLGGYPVSLNQQTQFGRFIRCDGPYDFSEEEVNWLQERNIRTVIDLRSSQERAHRPCFFAALPDFHYHVCEFYLGDLPKTEEAMVGMYAAAANEKTKIREALAIIAQAPGGVLYHCSAGKDRTGILSALLLALAGVAEVDILADYQVSFTYIKAKILQEYANVKDLPMFLMHSKVEYMEGFLNRLREIYGSVQAYLDATGITREEQDAIRRKLLEP